MGLRTEWSLVLSVSEHKTPTDLRRAGVNQNFRSVEITRAHGCQTQLLIIFHSINLSLFLSLVSHISQSLIGSHNFYIFFFFRIYHSILDKMHHFLNCQLHLIQFFEII